VAPYTFANGEIGRIQRPAELRFPRLAWCRPPVPNLPVGTFPSVIRGRLEVEDAGADAGGALVGRPGPVGAPGWGSVPVLLLCVARNRIGLAVRNHPGPRPTCKEPPMREFTQFWQAIDDIDGWLSEGQAQALCAAARAVPAPQRIVEIGSHLGRSTVLLALAAANGVKVHAVDPFDDPRWGGGAGLLEQFRRNLDGAGVTDRVDLYQGLSAAAAKAWGGDPVGLLFVDGAHDRASVLADIDGWTPHLADRARVYLHDAYSAPGVTMAVFERLFHGDWHYLGSSRSLAMFERSPSISFAARTASRAAMAARLGYFARNLAIKAGRKQGQTWVGPLLGWHEDAYPY
jgi:hypothetical protein